jgi:ABC-type transport system involved in Fe-S cluster assembly fused permease/ATPase subunit
VIIAAGLSAVMYLAAWGIVNGTLTLGDFVLANTYILQLYQPLGFFGFVYNEIKQALVDMERMFELLRESPDVPDRAGAEDLVVTNGVVRFENVSFAYGEREILSGVDFEIPAGHKLAVVGSSGAGKSTLSRLLFRFYDVSAGRITIDGQDLRDVKQASVAARHRDRSPGHGALQRQHRLQHRLRKARREPGGDRRGGPHGGAERVHRAPASGLCDPGG